MAILVINSGSSSIKFAVYDDKAATTLAKGIVERIGEKSTSGQLCEGDSEPVEITFDGATDHTLALDGILRAIRSSASLSELKIVATGHRVVHGGEVFPGPCVVDDNALAAIRDLAVLAPLHNQPNADGIEAARKIFPDAPAVAVFDTAFHQTLAPEVFRYAVPEDLYRQHGVRRYGFHGTSHQYVGARAVEAYGLDPANHRIITAHLGNGCSATAIANGRAVDTSMGITPLEGLVMGTRSGNVDPNLHHYIASRTGMSLAEISDLLNKRSGLLGLSGTSNDLRTLATLYRQSDKRAIIAVDVFCFRLAREIGGLSVALKGSLDALIFTGGIGENSRIVREKTLAHLSSFGFELDAAANEINGSESAGLISTDGSKPIAAVVATDEELAIAQLTKKLTN